MKFGKVLELHFTKKFNSNYKYYYKDSFEFTKHEV
jgi:hypothetical protein